MRFVQSQSDKNEEKKKAKARIVVTKTTTTIKDVLIARFLKEVLNKEKKYPTGL